MPKLLFILGMHRSGTSALAGVLAAAGAACGNPVIPANDGNPLGYWELAPLVELNDRLLACLKRNWSDPGPMESGWFEKPEVMVLGHEAEAILSQQFGQAEIALLKDPRLCLTMPFWRNAAMNLHFEHAVIGIARPAHEVVRSVFARDSLPARATAHLWARSMLEIARACLYDPSIIVTYDQLLTSPITVLQRINSILGASLPTENIESAINHELRHQLDDGLLEIPRQLELFCRNLYALFAEAASISTPIGIGRFHQIESAMEMMDCSLLPQVQQEALWESREQNRHARSEVDAARSNIHLLAQQVDVARQAHQDRDNIEAQLRKRILELECSIAGDSESVGKNKSDDDLSRA